MINWPSITFPPINLYILGAAWKTTMDNEDFYSSEITWVFEEDIGRAYQSRYVGTITRMEKLCLSKSRQGRYTRDCKWLRSAHTQSEHLWVTLKTHR